MPVTTFVTLILSVLAAAAITVFAIAEWGVLTVLPVLMAIALVARWAMSRVTLDDLPS